MARLFKLCMQTFEAARHEDGREYVKEEYKCGKWHASPEECIQENMTYIISHPRQKFTLIDEDFLEPTLEDPKDLSSKMCQSMVHMNNSSQINIIIKMSRKKHVVSSQEIISFNMWRFQHIGKPLSSEEMRNKLCRDLDYPKDRHFFAAITKEPNAPIIHMGATRNALYAVSPRPVHITRLQTVWDDYTKSKKATPNKEELAHQKWAKQHPEFCIKVLKEQGLKVLKPGIQVELGYTEV